MDTQSPFDIAKDALAEIAASRRFKISVSSGSIHEEDLLKAFSNLMERAGVDTNMVDMSVSNYPIEDRYAVNKRPKDYKFCRKTFIEMDDALLRIKLNGYNGHIVQCFENRDEAVSAHAADQGFSHAQWTDTVEEIDGYAEMIMIEAIDCDAFVSNLAAASIRIHTPSVQSKASTPRL